MEGPGETVSSNNFAPIANKVVPPQSSCKYLYKSHLYVRLNRSNRSNKCISLCEGDVLFNTQEKVKFSCLETHKKLIISWILATRMVLDGSVECCSFIHSRHRPPLPHSNRRKFRAFTARRVSLFNLCWVWNSHFSWSKLIELWLWCLFPWGFITFNRWTVDIAMLFDIFTEILLWNGCVDMVRRFLIKI